MTGAWSWFAALPRGPQIVVVLGLVLVATAVGSLVIDPADAPHGDRSGVACPQLRMARAATERADIAAARRHLRDAAVRSELALERSGEIFGELELAALRLEEDAKAGLPRRGLEQRLAELVALCDRAAS